ncbi:MAG: RsmB/NOP family class I SAM-dependent RNA methyltransferase [Chloroflexi bacterium]|nr:RsmB/NOP family class I SAM-dependent RNA methyltransferase [Chloroflexota bacterium]MCI0578802.1 RsmB/NOP family class I SAM-dependent RNA methyltransferase [Chloroflexota bacterium]MCI0644696.1 RsmB/NOP family class I SAM-dependent RNA methyltransferase [Chloroflexota bacterium]MCI0730394.1 RsmB/NOP family class I SAM-dependent RNA methyltransferase [Chloroflexota bacterium]
MSETLLELPEEFRQRLAAVLPGDALEGCLATFASQKPTAFRANTLKAGVAEVRAELEGQGLALTPVSWYPEAFLVDQGQRRALTESAAFYDGRIYIQNLSSMLAPLVLDPQPGEAVLDLAAAPGGKTLQLAAMMANDGRLVAVEAVKGRYYRLKANLQQYGATMVEAYLMDGRAAGRRWPQVFDRVLLDAPCSSEARFSQLEPESWAHWSTRKVKESAHKQKGLLQAAVYALRPGGTLVYCTCSFSPEENEVAVHALLRKFGPALEIEPISLPLDNVRPGLTEWEGKALHPDLAHSVRILPTEVMDGFYLCKLKKSNE